MSGNPADMTLPPLLSREYDHANGPTDWSTLIFHCVTILEPQKVSARQRILDAARPLIAIRGFSAVGINDVLNAAGVPKGSFYHHFTSKEVFGQALLAAYFDEALLDLDRALESKDLAAGDRLMRYWQSWASAQMGSDPAEKSLVVKLGAEVADLSDAMRHVLNAGTTRMIERLAITVSERLSEGTSVLRHEPLNVARALYGTWLGASVMAKITGSHEPFESASLITRHLLQLED